MGWTVEHLREAVNEINKELLRGEPQALKTIAQVLVRDGFAGVYYSERYPLLLVFKRTAQGWRIATIDDAREPLEKQLDRTITLLRSPPAAVQPGADEQSVRELVGQFLEAARTQDLRAMGRLSTTQPATEPDISVLANKPELRTKIEAIKMRVRARHKRAAVLISLADTDKHLILIVADRAQGWRVAGWKLLKGPLPPKFQKFFATPATQASANSPHLTALQESVAEGLRSPTWRQANHKEVHRRLDEFGQAWLATAQANGKPPDSIAKLYLGRYYEDNGRSRLLLEVSADDHGRILIAIEGHTPVPAIAEAGVLRCLTNDVVYDARTRGENATPTLEQLALTRREDGQYECARKTLRREAPQAADAVFGPVVEREITVKQERTGRCLIDLDTGDLFARPDLPPGTSSDRRLEWFRSRGIDAAASGSATRSGLKGLELTVKHIAPERWDKMTPEQLLAQLTDVQPRLKTYLFAGTDVATTRPVRDLGATYAFRTREGGTGLLQIVGPTDDARGVKIRYKMLNRPKLDKRATAPATHPVGGGDISVAVRPKEGTPGCVFFVNGQECGSADELRELLNARKDKAVSVTIDASANTQWRFVVEAYNCAVKAGFKNISFKQDR